MLDDDESEFQKLSSSEDELAILKNSRFLQGYLSFMKGLIRFRFLALLAALGGIFGIIFIYATVSAPRNGMEFSTLGAAGICSEHKAPVGTTLQVSDKYVNELEDIVRPYGGSVEALLRMWDNDEALELGIQGNHYSHSHVVVPFPDWMHGKKNPRL